MVDQTELDPPTFVFAGRMQIHTSTGVRIAGFYGRCPERGAKAAMSKRNSHQHRLRALDAYAFSLTVIGVMEKLDTEYLFVYETNTGDVYEWKYTALRYADEVPDKFLDSAGDPQKYIPRQSARAVWHGHGDRFVSHPDPPESDPEFTKASEVDDTPETDAGDSPVEELSPEERLELAYKRGEGDDDA